jgi:hypothetical protein
LIHRIPAFTKTLQEARMPARAINMLSIGHQIAPGIWVEFESLKGGPERDAVGSVMGPWYASFNYEDSLTLRRLYGESKPATILTSNYFAQLHSDVLVSFALHSGFIATDL